MMMRRLKFLGAVWIMLLLAGCANDGLEKMIPADATGVVCFDVPEILKKAGMMDDRKIVLPASLQQVIDGNDVSPLCILLSDLPQLGLDTGSKAYAVCHRDCRNTEINIHCIPKIGSGLKEILHGA